MIAEKLPPPGRMRVGSFAASICYAAGKAGAAWTHLRGVTSVETAALEMDAVAALSRCCDPVAHWTLSYANGENATPAMMIADAEAMLTELGMGASQCVIIAHADTDNLHTHLISNRVGANGRAASTSHDFVKAERWVAKVAYQRGWTVVSGFSNQDIVQRQQRDAATICNKSAIPKGSPQRRLKGRQYDRLNRTGELTWNDIKRAFILNAVTSSRNWDDLIVRLAEGGIVLKHEMKVGRGHEFHGLAFAESEDDDAPGCSASAISPECRYAALATRFGPWPAAQVGAKPIPEIEKKSSRISGEPQTPNAPDRAPDAAQAAAKLKLRYEAYVADFRKARRAEKDSDWQRAWHMEKDQRRTEIARLYSRRNENKRYARATSRDRAATAIILFIIDAAYGWLIKRARQRARERWLATKMEMGMRPARHPCRYAEWIRERAAEGDAAAVKEKAILASARRSAHRQAPAAVEVKPYRPARPLPQGFER